VREAKLPHVAPATYFGLHIEGASDYEREVTKIEGVGPTRFRSAESGEIVWLFVVAVIIDINQRAALRIKSRTTTTWP